MLLVARSKLGDDRPHGKRRNIYRCCGRDEQPHRCPSGTRGGASDRAAVYRAYAKNFRELARASESEPQRDMYLKAAQMWLDAATRFEFETGHFISGANSNPLLDVT